MSVRPVKRLVKAKPTLEGAGVNLPAEARDASATRRRPRRLVRSHRHEHAGAVARGLQGARCRNVPEIEDQELASGRRQGSILRLRGKEVGRCA